MANIEAVKIWVGTEWVEIAQPVADGGNEGDVLTWSGGEWIAAAPTGGGGGIDIDGTASGQLLQWDDVAGSWVSQSEGTASGQLLSWDATASRWVPTSTALDDYLPLAGGTMTGAISWDTGVLINDAYGLANTFSVSTEGLERFRVDSNAITARRQFLLQNSVDSNAPALAFGNYKKTGLYLTGVDDFAFANNGVQTFRMYANGQAVFGNGNAPPGTTLTVNGSLSVANVSGTAMILRPTLNCTSATTVSGFYSHPIVNGSYADYVGIVSGKPTGNGVRSGAYRSFQAEVEGPNSTAYYTNNQETVNSWAFYQAGGAPSRIPNLQVNFGAEVKPAISFEGKTGTGLFLDGAGDFCFSTEGTMRLHVTSAGQITAAAGYAPTRNQDLATKQYVDDSFWVGTLAQYNAIGAGNYNPNTLYLITG